MLALPGTDGVVGGEALCRFQTVEFGIQRCTGVINGAQQIGIVLVQQGAQQIDHFVRYLQVGGKAIEVDMAVAFFFTAAGTGVGQVVQGAGDDADQLLGRQRLGQQLLLEQYAIGQQLLRNGRQALGAALLEQAVLKAVEADKARVLMLYGASPFEEPQATASRLQPVMTLGQEFRAFATTLGEDLARLKTLAPELLTEVNLGGTAIGTGINADPRYQLLAVNRLATISGHPLVPAADLIEATSDMGAFVLFSGMLKRTAVKLSKICNDLRLLSSGPRTGINEINLPARQPGSSIMPGKVNPVIPEAVNQVAFQVIGNDLALTMAAEGGQLQLNVMEPLIAFKIFDSIRLLQRAMDMLREHCIVGITANEARCRELVEHSIGLVTALNPYIGYENATRIARIALESGRGVLELVREEGLLDDAMLDSLSDIIIHVRYTARSAGGLG